MSRKPKIADLLLQSLETELGGEHVYETALKCVRNEALREEWEKYLMQTSDHVQVMRDLLTAAGLDPDDAAPSREIVRMKARALVSAMEKALADGPPAAAELVAAECVVDAEAKDHMNWQLIGEAAKVATGDLRKALEAAHERVEDEEDEHLYHSRGWARELWLASMGLPAVLPPPEEKRDVHTAIGAERARNARKRMIRAPHRKTA